MVIDPGAPAPEVEHYLRSGSLELTHIVLTHLHSDHTAGAAPFARAFNAPIFASNQDRWMLDHYLGKGDDDWGIPTVEPFTFHHLGQGLLPAFGGACCVLETPGHSPGGLTFYFAHQNALFPGDTLFRNTLGRTDFTGGDEVCLKRSLQDAILPLPGRTMVYAGHGKPFLLEESVLFQHSAR